MLGRLLAWEDAHAGFDAAVADVPVAVRGTTPAGLPHSTVAAAGALATHQHDILDFCINPRYEELNWPKDYWPASTTPPSDAAWDESIASYRDDCAALQRLAGDASVDLTAKIPHGSGQTYARELLVVADHTSYHVGQLILVRQALGAWKRS